MEVETDRIAHSLHHRLNVGAVEVHAKYLRMRIGRQAEVARRSDRHVELAIRTDLDELPAMGHVAG